MRLTLINPAWEGKDCLFSFPTGKAAGAKLPLPKRDGLEEGGTPRLLPGCRASEAGFILEINRQPEKYLCDELPGLMPWYGAALLPQKSRSKTSVHPFRGSRSPRGGGKASGCARW